MQQRNSRYNHFGVLILAAGILALMTASLQNVHAYSHESADVADVDDDDDALPPQESELYATEYDAIVEEEQEADAPENEVHENGVYENDVVEYNDVVPEEVEVVEDADAMVDEYVTEDVGVTTEQEEEEVDTADDYVIEEAEVIAEEADVVMDEYEHEHMAELDERAKALLTIESVDLSGDPLPGMWTTIRNMEGDLEKFGFTPLTFAGTPETDYVVTVADYDGRIFAHWEDGSTSDLDWGAKRTVTLSEETTTTTIIASYDPGDSLGGFTPLTYTGTEEQHELTVEAVSLDGETMLNMWVIIDPQSGDNQSEEEANTTTSTTYKIYLSNHMDIVFSHWEDESTDMIRTLTIGEPTTITAFYDIDDAAVIDEEEIPELTFEAPLSGSQEVPPVETDASGHSSFTLNADGIELHYSVTVSNITNVTEAHIHLGQLGENGPPVVFLFGPVEPDGETMEGVLAEGTITSGDLIGPLAGMAMDDLIDEIMAGNTYVNVHTSQNPAGEIRGQIVES